MIWRKLKKMLQEHPYLIDDAFHMPMKQAMDLQESEGYPSFEEMVLRAKWVSTAPASAWAPVDAVIARRQHKQKSLFGLWLRPPTKVALVGLCLLLLASYLAFAPSGRAFAASFVKIVMQIVDNGFRFSPVGTPDVSPRSDEIIPYEETVEEFIDFDAAEKASQRQFVRLDGDMFILESLTLYDNSLSGILLSATYKTSDDIRVYLQQEWRKGASGWGEINPDETVWEETLSDGTILYCFIGSEDGIFTATAAWRDEIITIYAEEGISYQDVIKAIKINE